MQDLQGYLQRMEKSMTDKLFFVDKIDLTKFDLVVDFGCADGTFIKYLNELYDSQNFLGYDISQQMIEKARQNVNCENVKFTGNLQELYEFIAEKKYAIVFSSVLHELGKDDFDLAINLMKNSSAVIIRDMYFDKTRDQKFDCSKILENRKTDENLVDFEKKYGKIDNLLNLYHYFLKYTYTQNWQTEVLENYFGIDYQKIFDNLKNNFEILYDEKFTLPYKKDEIKKNFDFDLSLPTHRKLIFVKR